MATPLAAKRAAYFQRHAKDVITDAKVAVHLPAKSVKPYHASSLVEKRRVPFTRLTKQMSSKHTLLSLGAAARVLMTKLSSAQREKIDFDAKYVMVDTKETQNPIAARIDDLTDQLKTLREIARNQFGNKAIRIALYIKSTFDVSGGGVMANVIAVDPQITAEFSSLSALFDEYRVLGGVYKFNTLAVVPNTAAATDPFAIVVYEPSDATAPTSVATSLTKQQHMLVPMPVVAGVGVAGAVLAGVTQHVTKEFRWAVPPGIILTSSGSAAANPTSTWQNTTSAAGTYYPYGWLKAYGTALTPVSTTGLCGYQEYHCEFRCRE